MENLLFKLTEYQYEILMAILERPGQILVISFLIFRLLMDM